MNPFKRKVKSILAFLISVSLMICLLPVTAFADFYSIDIQPDKSDSGGYDYIYTVGDSVNLVYECASDVPVMEGNFSISSGSLPDDLGIAKTGGGQLTISGRLTAVTSGAQSATIWAKNTHDEENTRDITFTVNKTYPTIAGSNNLSHEKGGTNGITATATITNGFFGGSTTNMSLTATITDSTNTATGTATATGSNVSIDFPAAQLNNLAVGGPYDIVVSEFTGNANNNGFADTKIGVLTVNAASVTGGMLTYSPSTITTAGGTSAPGVSLTVNGTAYTPSTSAAYSYSSGNTGIATVNGISGVATAVANGTAAITLTVVDGAYTFNLSADVVVNIPTTDKLLISITQPSVITGVANGAAKTAAGLGLPATVTMVTDGGNVQAGVTWDVAACSYNQSSTSAQTFTVSGTAALPAGVVNTNGVSLCQRQRNGERRHVKQR